MTHRWPLHPTPGEGEALTAWLNRLAATYGMTVDNLIRHNLASPGVDLADYHTSILDVAPPEELLSALRQRTGVCLAQLRQMTVAGWAPWLVDTLEPEPSPGAAFDTYVHQDSVLLTTTERPRRQVPAWQAWLPTDPKRGPLRRACPICLNTAATGSFGFTLVSQLPLTVSCPQHSCRLELAFGGLGAFVAWEKQDTHASAAPAHTVIMDARTHQGLRTGSVVLPRRSVHVGVWLRLLRTIIDELSTPVSAVRPSSRRTMEYIWHTTGHPPRAGIVGPWRSYETLSWPQQQMFLEAAATALHLIEVAEITGRGGLAPLLTLEPHRPVHDGTPPDSVTVSYWQQATDAIDDAITLAQNDPAAARQMLAVLTARTRTEATFQRIRNDLLTLGIAERHLPATLVETRQIPTNATAPVKY